jgi:hypothetical protein
MSKSQIKSRRELLRRVVLPGWGMLALLVLLIDPLMTRIPILGTAIGLLILLLNTLNAIRVVSFIRQSYPEAAKSDELLQSLNLPVRTVPVVFVLGSVGLAFYLSCALVVLATLAKYSVGGAIAKPLIVFAMLQLAILAPLYFWMDKKLVMAEKR